MLLLIIWSIDKYANKNTKKKRHRETTPFIISVNLLFIPEDQSCLQGVPTHQTLLLSHILISQLPL